MKKLNRTDPVRQKLIKVVRTACFSVFVFSVILFAVVAITYQSSDQWQSSRAPTRIFDDIATVETNASVLTTGVDIDIDTAPLAWTHASRSPVNESRPEAMSTNVALKSGCGDVVNCSDPGVLAAIQSFHLRAFKAIEFLEYQTPVKGPGMDECDVAWRFTKVNANWRKYRDFRRYKMGYNDNCSYKVIRPGRWHSGLNAFRSRTGGNRQKAKIDTSFPDVEINDSIPLGSDSAFSKGRYLYYSRGGDYCKSMNQYTWSFLCGLGEAMYLNRTFVMDFSVCLAATYTKRNKDEEGKDFRFYFDFEHLKEVASLVEDVEFIRDWKRWDKRHQMKISVRKVGNHKVTPMQLRREKSTIIWRQFDGPEPENYWYRVCDGLAAKYIKRPWNVLWTSKTLRKIADEISASMDRNFDAVDLVRGEKARNKELWPHLDADTSPDALVAKLQGTIMPWRQLYISTNEPSYNFFDKLRSRYKVHLLDDYKYLWGSTSEWYNETFLLNKGHPVEFDGYMRVSVDTEVLYRAKTRVETFYNLTKDCKDGINMC